MDSPTRKIISNPVCIHSKSSKANYRGMLLLFLLLLAVSLLFIYSPSLLQVSSLFNSLLSKPSSSSSSLHSISSTFSPATTMLASYRWVVMSPFSTLFHTRAPTSTLLLYFFLFTPFFAEATATTTTSPSPTSATATATTAAIIHVTNNSSSPTRYSAEFASHHSFLCRFTTPMYTNNNSNSDSGVNTSSSASSRGLLERPRVLQFVALLDGVFPTGEHDAAAGLEAAFNEINANDPLFLYGGGGGEKSCGEQELCPSTSTRLELLIVDGSPAYSRSQPNNFTALRDSVLRGIDRLAFAQYVAAIQPTLRNQSAAAIPDYDTFLAAIAEQQQQHEGQQQERPLGGIMIPFSAEDPLITANPAGGDPTRARISVNASDPVVACSPFMGFALSSYAMSALLERFYPSTVASTGSGSLFSHPPSYGARLSDRFVLQAHHTNLRGNGYAEYPVLVDFMLHHHHALCTQLLGLFTADATASRYRVVVDGFVDSGFPTPRIITRAPRQQSSYNATFVAEYLAVRPGCCVVVGDYASVMVQLLSDLHGISAAAAATATAASSSSPQQQEQQAAPFVLEHHKFFSTSLLMGGAGNAFLPVADKGLAQLYVSGVFPDFHNQSKVLSQRALRAVNALLAENRTRPPGIAKFFTTTTMTHSHMEGYILGRLLANMVRSTLNVTRWNVFDAAERIRMQLDDFALGPVTRRCQYGLGFPCFCNIIGKAYFMTVGNSTTGSFHAVKDDEVGRGEVDLAERAGALTECLLSGIEPRRSFNILHILRDASSSESSNSSSDALCSDALNTPSHSSSSASPLRCALRRGLAAANVRRDFRTVGGLHHITHRAHSTRAANTTTNSSGSIDASKSTMAMIDRYRPFVVVDSSSARERPWWGTSTAAPGETNNESMTTSIETPIVFCLDEDGSQARVSDYGGSVMEGGSPQEVVPNTNVLHLNAALTHHIHALVHGEFAPAPSLAPRRLFVVADSPEILTFVIASLHTFGVSAPPVETFVVHTNAAAPETAENPLNAPSTSSPAATSSNWTGAFSSFLRRAMPQCVMSSDQQDHSATATTTMTTTTTLIVASLSPAVINATLHNIQRIVHACTLKGTNSKAENGTATHQSSSTTGNQNSTVPTSGGDWHVLLATAETILYTTIVEPLLQQQRSSENSTVEAQVETTTTTTTGGPMTIDNDEHPLPQFLMADGCNASLSSVLCVDVRFSTVFTAAWWTPPLPPAEFPSSAASTSSSSTTARSASPTALADALTANLQRSSTTDVSAVFGVLAAEALLRMAKAAITFGNAMNAKTVIDSVGHSFTAAGVMLGPFYTNTCPPPPLPTENRNNETTTGTSSSVSSTSSASASVRSSSSSRPLNRQCECAIGPRVLSVFRLRDWVQQRPPSSPSATDSGRPLSVFSMTGCGIAYIPLPSDPTNAGRLDALQTATTIAAAAGGSAGFTALLIGVIMIVLCCCVGRSHRNAPVNTERVPFAIVFTDIQSSTALWARLPAVMSEAVDAHQKLVRKLIRRHKGYEVKTIGDSFMVVFKQATDATTFAVHLQRALYAAPSDEAVDGVYRALALEAAASSTDHTNGTTADNSCIAAAAAADASSVPPPALDPIYLPCHAFSYRQLWRGLRVRIGVHFGTCTAAKDETTGSYDYYGTLVNTAARIEGVGWGGQILVSHEVLEALPVGFIEMNTEAVVTKMGPQMLRGLQDPIRLFQVVPKELSLRTFPPLRLDVDAAATVTVPAAAGSEEEEEGGGDFKDKSCTHSSSCSSHSPSRSKTNTATRTSTTTSTLSEHHHIDALVLRNYGRFRAEELRKLHAVASLLFATSPADWQRSTLEALMRRWHVSHAATLAPSSAQRTRHHLHRHHSREEADHFNSGSGVRRGLLVLLAKVLAAHNSLEGPNVKDGSEIA